MTESTIVEFVERKDCTGCGHPKLLSEFPVDTRNSDGHMGSCKACENERSKKWAAANPSKVRGFRRSHYNIDFNVLWEKQSGLCALCSEPMLPRGKGGKSVVVDHDHNCCPPKPGRARSSCGNCVRGLLHSHCNMLVGMVEKNHDKLSLANNYLQTWKGGLQ